jgi:hypothetical protein
MTVPAVWTGTEPNFALTEFYEVRYRKQRPSNNKDTLFGGYAAASKPCTLPPLANRGGGPKHPFFLRPINERVAPMKRIFMLMARKKKGQRR